MSQELTATPPGIWGFSPFYRHIAPSRAKTAKTLCPAGAIWAHLSKIRGTSPKVLGSMSQELTATPPGIWGLGLWGSAFYTPIAPFRSRFACPDGIGEGADESS